LFAPTSTDIDAAVRREFPLFESARLTVQADAFNLLNKVYFGAPNTTLSSTSFGTYTTQGNLPRKFQFSARITF
jgi:outer membrane receptor protein involved in Fe transport